jgi:hypothetical protein
MAGLTDADYFNYVPWFIISALSLMYPVNNIGLTLFFEPLFYIFWFLLKIDYNKTHQGNFARIDEDG